MPITQKKQQLIIQSPKPMFQWLICFTVALLMMLSGNAAYAASPAAGTSIGNQASATYTDGSGANRTVTSNTVQTVVQQVASLTLTVSGAKLPRWVARFIIHIP